YSTMDWAGARRSVERLAELEPEIAATGHGRPLRGPALRAGLDELAHRFGSLAVPKRGRYLRAPALAGPDGVTAVPPRVAPAGLVLGLAAVVLAGVVLSRRRA
ncbi:MAG TPA: hypothetical protein VFT84_03450, partial [Gemmatimonadales bacterium]|nr:hypothetical protein [Gemmatimonadales bacterium]